jgi:citrate lyase subunit beta / citryl-CoA lyase
MRMTKASAGQRGEKVRSDCYVELELKNQGRIQLDIQSKVASMYGTALKEEILQMCRFFGIKNASVIIEDNGALPFVIAARFETAFRRINPSLENEYLPPFNEENNYSTAKDKLRRSRLYLPGNEPKFFVNAGLHKPDGIILDLEDSVSPSEKDSAQLIVRNALRSVDFYGAERMVRINQLPKGLDDLKYVIPHNVNLILIPKCESAEQVKEVETEVNRIKAIHKIKNPVYFMPILESALGILKAYEIAAASENNCALAIGLEDYTADIGTQRTLDGKESFFARSMLLNAAKAAGIQAIDTVFSDVNDMEGLKASVLEAKSMGFEGKGCIHPRQIQVVHKAFSPTAEEIDKAKKIVIAFEDAQKKGLGVVSLGSKMIDAPVVKRAQKVVKLAVMNGLMEEDWKEKK